MPHRQASAAARSPTDIARQHTPPRRHERHPRNANSPAGCGGPRSDPRNVWRLHQPGAAPEHAHVQFRGAGTARPTHPAHRRRNAPRRTRAARGRAKPWRNDVPCQHVRATPRHKIRHKRQPWRPIAPCQHVRATPRHGDTSATRATPTPLPGAGGPRSDPRNVWRLHQPGAAPEHAHVQFRGAEPRARRTRPTDAETPPKNLYVFWYSGPSPPSGVVSRPPFAVIAPHCTQFV
jgi:hypothetical protein